MSKRIIICLLGAILGMAPVALSVNAAAACTTTTSIGPLGTAAWCQSLVDAPGTYTDLANGWNDNFTYSGSPANLANDANQDSGYMTWESRNQVQSQQFRSNGMWFADDSSGGNGGAIMRPDRSFTMQNGHLVVDAENAVYPRGDVEWSEIIITTSDHPTNNTQGLYGRDQFIGNDTFACLFKHDPNYHNVIACALIGTGSYTPGTEANYICRSDNNGSLCGTGFDLFDDSSFKLCSLQPSDVSSCLNNFRLDLTPNGWTVQTNGTTWLQDSFKLPSDLTGQVYVYFSSWAYFSPGVVRHSWRHLGINSENTPTPTPAPTPTPTPSPSPTPLSITNVPCTVQLPSGPANGTCSGTFNPQ